MTATLESLLKGAKLTFSFVVPLLKLGLALRRSGAGNGAWATGVFGFSQRVAGLQALKTWVFAWESGPTF